MCDCYYYYICMNNHHCCFVDLICTGHACQWRWIFGFGNGIYTGAFVNLPSLFSLLPLIMCVRRKLPIFIDITAAAVCINNFCDVQNDKHRQAVWQKQTFFLIFFIYFCCNYFIHQPSRSGRFWTLWLVAMAKTWHCTGGCINRRWSKTRVIDIFSTVVLLICFGLTLKAFFWPLSCLRFCNWSWLSFSCWSDPVSRRLSAL